VTEQLAEKKRKAKAATIFERLQQESHKRHKRGAAPVAPAAGHGMPGMPTVARQDMMDSRESSDLVRPPFSLSGAAVPFWIGRSAGFIPSRRPLSTDSQ
jgi:hypothetical protein